MPEPPNKNAERGLNRKLERMNGGPGHDRAKVAQPWHVACPHPAIFLVRCFGPPEHPFLACFRCFFPSSLLFAMFARFEVYYLQKQIKQVKTLKIILLYELKLDKRGT